jgi:hypothetical protein
MSICGALAGGFAGTLVLITILRAASELRLTRIDLPFLLGTALTANRLRAKALGYALHFLAGFGFAVVYYTIFVAIDRSGSWFGATMGSFMHCSQQRRSSTCSCRSSIHAWAHPSRAQTRLRCSSLPASSC